jgi:PLP dependent protein
MIPLTPNANIEEDVIAARFNAVRKRIAAAERRYDRTPGSVTLMAVAKSQAASTVMASYQAGQRDFGESYLQEALPKLNALSNLDITWHFIGAIQSNKTRDIAGRFAWVHSIDRIKIAERLHEQRPQHLPPLDICIQVNIGEEQQKAGAVPTQLPSLIGQLLKLSRLRVRGLMALPPASDDFHEQRGYFHQLKLAYETLRLQDYPLDTLSMGMSGDLEAAIAEGATLVRVGNALFGDRPHTP